MKFELPLQIICFLLLSVACNSNSIVEASDKNDSINNEFISHGYNELANPENHETFCISDFNTDNPDIVNIQRPKVSIIKTQLDTNLLFGIWTVDPQGPHADFQLTAKSFFVVDYDGDGDMPYELKGNEMKIYYNDFIQEGQVISVNKDTLKIRWKGFNNVRNYVRWPKEE